MPNGPPSEDAELTKMDLKSFLVLVLIGALLAVSGLSGRRRRDDAGAKASG